MQTELEIRKRNNEFYKKYGKRLLDLIVSIPSLIILLPLFAVIGIAIKIDAKGPIIYKQKRVGKNKQDFYVYKFRTMVFNADKIGPTSTKTDDSRITRVGKVLRKFSLDELPQLANVFLGEMSIVGYRPGVRNDYSSDELENSNLFIVKPGITGYAQVNGRSRLSLEEKRYWEKKYIRDISFSTDLKIIIKTIKVVLRTENTN